MRGWARAIANTPNAYLWGSLAATFIFLLVIGVAVLAYLSDITIKGAGLYQWMTRRMARSSN